jgi:pyruvate/2-oxoglutarate dehydrogenase complex dihydrolipoamide dehydrogenase (E3) component
VGVLADSFLGMGVTFHMQERVAEIRREGNGTVTLLESGKQIRSDAVLYAQGREPNSEKLQVSRADIIAKTAGSKSINIFKPACRTSSRWVI